jgi:hypothetical protein
MQSIDLRRQGIVTTAARIIGVVSIAVALAACATAQDLSLPVAGDTMTPAELSLPGIEDEGQSLVVPPLGDGTLALPAPIAIDAAHGIDHHAAVHPELWDHFPAPVESSGTWLRRGFWYAEADAVVWNRHWNRDNMWMAAGDPDVNSPLFFFQFQGLINTNRLLILEGAHPGEDTSVRVTLGHFLFRDQRNRDHTVEFTAFAGGDWEQNRVITSLNPFGLFVPFTIDGGNRSFDGSSRQSVDYSSHYNSFELNYRLKQRMTRDQLVMDPDGNWHRAASPGWNFDYLAGLRMIEMRDILNWFAQDIFILGSDGAYFIRTDNDMFGLQLGVGCTFESSRWSAGMLAKGGVYVNDALARTTLNFTDEDDVDDDFDLRLTEDELSMVMEVRVGAKWHLTPNFSLRGAYELMYLTSMALAPNQANFIPDYATLNTSQDPFYHGASFGFEAYW